MPLKFHWFLPTQGDGRGLIETGAQPPAGVAGRPPRGLGRLPDPGRDRRRGPRLRGRADPGPAGWCDDAWVVTAMLAQTSERLKFLVAFRPGLVSPTLAAQMAATFQWHSGGRLLLNVVTGGDPGEQRAFGDFLDKEERYRRTGEFLEIVSPPLGRRDRRLQRRAPAGRGGDDPPPAPTRGRRSTSAAPRPPGSRSRPGTSTST